MALMDKKEQARQIAKAFKRVTANNDAVQSQKLLYEVAPEIEKRYGKEAVEAMQATITPPNRSAGQWVKDQLNLGEPSETQRLLNLQAEHNNTAKALSRSEYGSTTAYTTQPTIQNTYTTPNYYDYANKRNDDFIWVLSWLLFIGFFALIFFILRWILSFSAQKTVEKIKKNKKFSEISFIEKEIKRLKRWRENINIIGIVSGIVIGWIFPLSILNTILILVCFNFYYSRTIKKLEQLKQNTNATPVDLPKNKPTTPVKQAVQTQKEANQKYIIRREHTDSEPTPQPEKTTPQYSPQRQQAENFRESLNRKWEIDQERHQAELDRYLNKNHSASEIGKIYERQIGYMFEQKGYSVVYQGILRGVEDEGIDLIARKDNQILLIQTKNWSEKHTIRENQINQFKGSADLFVAEHNKAGIQWAYVFISSQPVSERAAQVAKQHRIKLIVQPLSKGFPMIKCKVNRREKTRLYHLPTDQQYDKIVIRPENGDCYAHTIFEAEFKGFERRAYRWRGVKET